MLRLRESRARSGTAWTDSGEAHDQRGLKHRSRKAVRYVPIPPELVALLRWHVVRFGTEPDGRMFRTARGGMVQESGYGEVWPALAATSCRPASSLRSWPSARMTFATQRSRLGSAPVWSHSS
jgi:hypothetical protein